MPPKIILGTVKLGNPHYGYSSTKNAKFNSLTFLNKINELGINYFDTSPRYDKSEILIGQFVKKYKKNISISSKIDNLKNNDPNSEKVIFESVENSLRNLNIDKLDICYLHQNDFEIISDKFILKNMAKLKLNGLVNKIGTSIYYKNECEFSLECDEMDVIQIPVNILDFYLYKMILNSTTNKKIVARSLFLQGVITNMKKIKNHKFQNKLNSKIKYLNELATNNQMSLAEFCVSAICSLPKIYGIIIGSTSIINMKNNLNYMKNTVKNNILNELLNHYTEDNSITNPKNW